MPLSVNYPVLFACVFTAATLTAQEPERDTSAHDRLRTAAEHYVGANTLAVGYVDVDPAWVESAEDVLKRYIGEAASEEPAAEALHVAQAMIAGVRSAGAREAMVVVAIEDLVMRGGPLVVITTTGGDAERKVVAVAKGLREMGGPWQGLVVVGDGNGNLLVGTEQVVERYRELKPIERADLIEPLIKTLESGRGEDARHGGSSTSGAIVVAPSDDARRVIRELWPALPRPFNELTGGLMADGVSHLAVRVTRPPEWSIDARLIALSEDAAEKVNQASVTGLKLAVETISRAKPPLAEIVQQAAELLQMEQSGATLSIRVAHDSEGFAALVNKVLVPAVQEARERAYRSQQTNNLKQIALAMLNFHDVAKHFPAPAAIVDKDGKPLLSWRVAVLRYLDQQALFNQFRLDEPWDSPHNLKLAKTMPLEYMDPSHPELAREGKTVYQLPVHAESAFPPAGEVEPKEVAFGGKRLFIAPGLQYRDITDGTSNTVMIVATAPEDAVVWTKPDDWEVDLARAWQQLKGQGNKTTVAAFCDGSAHAWDHHDERMEELLPKLITRTGREVIEW